MQKSDQELMSNTTNRCAQSYITWSFICMEIHFTLQESTDTLYSLCETKISLLAWDYQFINQFTNRQFFPGTYCYVYVEIMTMSLQDPEKERKKEII